MANGIYSADGSFLPFKAQDLSTEIATRQNAGIVLGNTGLWLNQLPDPDPVLQKRGDDASILASLYADDQVTSATLARKNRVLNAPNYGYRAGAPEGDSITPKAQLVYDKLSQDLERTNLRTLISSILDAPFYGMTALELLWKFGNGWWHLTDIVARPYHWFAYDVHNQPIFRGMGGLALCEPVPLPIGKFVIVSHHATYDNPYGLRLLARCLWPVAFKRGGMQFYAKFVERHGLPWVIGTAPPGATKQDKREMANDLARMVQDCVAALPAGADVKFMEPASGQDLVHERFISRQDKAISKLLMGQTLTMEMEGRNNSQAAASTHGDVAEGLALSDKAMVVDAFNEIAWLYTQVNAGKDVFAPIFAYEEPEDLLAKATLDKTLVEIGVRFTAEHFQENYNLKDTEFTLADGQESSSEIPDTSQNNFSFSAESEQELPIKAQNILDEVIKNLLPEAITANENFITELENVITNAKSFDALQLELAELLAPKLQASALENLLGETMTAAAGFGATAVNEEIKADKD